MGGGTTGGVQPFAGDLSHVRLTLGAGELAHGPEETHFFAFSNSVRATVLAGVTWLTADNALACLQPHTGQVLAEQPGDQTRGPIITADPATANGDIYGLGADGLIQLRPPASAFVSELAQIPPTCPPVADTLGDISTVVQHAIAVGWLAAGTM